MTKEQVTLAGFGEDIRSVLEAIPRGVNAFCVDENTNEGISLPRANLVIYVFSADTGYSSLLLSWFTWIHHHASPQKELVLCLGKVREIFPFLRDIPTISIDDLGEIMPKRLSQ